MKQRGIVSREGRGGREGGRETAKGTAAFRGGRCTRDGNSVLEEGAGRDDGRAARGSWKGGGKVRVIGGAGRRGKWGGKKGLRGGGRGCGAGDAGMPVTEGVDSAAPLGCAAFVASTDALVARLGRGVVYYGSARLKQDSPHWERAVELGREVSQLLGSTTWSGGGPGMMEAASQGAMQALPSPSSQTKLPAPPISRSSVRQPFDSLPPHVPLPCPITVPHCSFPSHPLYFAVLSVLLPSPSLPPLLHPPPLPVVLLCPAPPARFLQNLLFFLSAPQVARHSPIDSFAAAPANLQAGKVVGGIRISREAGTTVLTASYLPADNQVVCKYLSPRKVALVDAGVRKSEEERTAYIYLPGTTSPPSLLPFLSHFPVHLSCPFRFPLPSPSPPAPLPSLSSSVSLPLSLPSLPLCLHVISSLPPLRPFAGCSSPHACGHRLP